MPKHVICCHKAHKNRCDKCHDLEMLQERDRLVNEGAICFICKKQKPINMYDSPYKKNAHCSQCSIECYSTCVYCKAYQLIKFFDTRNNGEIYKKCRSCDMYRKGTDYYY